MLKIMEHLYQPLLKAIECSGSSEIVTRVSQKNVIFLLILLFIYLLEIGYDVISCVI